MRALLFAFIALVTASTASAHPLDVGLLELKARGSHSFDLRVELNPNLVAELLKVEPSSLNAESTPARAAAITELTLARAQFTRGPSPCSVGETRASYVDETALRLEAQLDCASETESASLKIAADFLKGWPDTFVLVVKASLGGDERLQSLTPSRTEVELSTEVASGFGEFFMMGVEHIGAAPSEWRADDGSFQLADGIDHLLFILALVVGSVLIRERGLKELLLIVTGFTLGHSVTLALGSFEIVVLPGRLVESIIALSIAAVGAENLLRRELVKRWHLATAFGLIHGLGLSGTLAEFELATSTLVKGLVAFNLGVEFGQLVVVALSLIFVWPLRRLPKFGKPFAYLVSGLVAVLGFYWFVERAIG